MEEQRQTPLAINDVRDRLGEFVPQGGTTEFTTLSLEGSAVPNSVVIIRDNGVIVGTASVRLDSIWEKTVDNLVLGEHRFTVGTPSGEVSAPWVLTVAEVLDLPAPVVVSAVNDVLDPLLAQAGTDVRVSYTGMLTTDRISLSWGGRSDWVLPQDGSVSGIVTFNMPAAAIGQVLDSQITVIYTMTRGEKSIPSQTRVLTVRPLPASALPAPRIRQAPDDRNLDISALSRDADLYVPVWPFIAVGQRIFLRFEGTRADGSVYEWRHDVWQDFRITSTGEPATTVKLSDLKTLRNGSDLRLLFEVSFNNGMTVVAFPVRTLTIIAKAAAPNIIRIADSRGVVIPPGSGTLDTAVTVSGVAKPDARVEVFDGAVSWGTAPTSVNDSWVLSRSGLTVKAYNITARGLYDDNPVSGAYPFNKLQNIPPLIVDISPVTLSGGLYAVDSRPDIEPVNWPAGTFITRVPSSGQPPYTYTASDARIIHVNAAGFVGARMNGVSGVTIRDAAGQVAVYSVTVTGVQYCYGLGTGYFAQAQNIAHSKGLVIPTMATLRTVYATYGARWPQGNAYYWSRDPAAIDLVRRNYTKNLVTGVEAAVRTAAVPGAACLITAVLSG